MRKACSESEFDHSIKHLGNHTTLHKIEVLSKGIPYCRPNLVQPVGTVYSWAGEPFLLTLGRLSVS